MDYQLTIQALAAVAVLMLVQIIVVDVASIRTKHTPGAPVPADHGNFLFRATRVLGNTNESIAVFVLLVLYCVHTGAAHDYTAIAAWAYVAARIAHALCYYFDQRILRSVAFGLSLLALFGLLFVGLLT